MDKIEYLLAEVAIEKSVTGYLAAIDARRWDEVPRFFADRVYVDFTSVRPLTSARTLWIDELVTQWCSSFGQEIDHQHETSNLVVRILGDRAQCTGNNVSSHVMREAQGGHIVLRQVGCTLEWNLERSRQAQWVINMVRGQYLWHRIEPYTRELKEWAPMPTQAATDLSR